MSEIPLYPGCIEGGRDPAFYRAPHPDTALQWYLTHKNSPPPPRATIGPWAWAYCRVRREGLMSEVPLYLSPLASALLAPNSSPSPLSPPPPLPATVGGGACERVPSWGFLKRPIKDTI